MLLARDTMQQPSLNVQNHEAMLISKLWHQSPEFNSGGCSHIMRSSISESAEHETFMKPELLSFPFIKPELLSFPFIASGARQAVKTSPSGVRCRLQISRTAYISRKLQSKATSQTTTSAQVFPATYSI